MTPPSPRTKMAVAVLLLVVIGLGLDALGVGEGGWLRTRVVRKNARDTLPRDPRTLLHRSRRLIALKRHGEAEGVLKKALKVAVVGGRDAESLVVQGHLGMLFVRQGKYWEAEQVLRASIRTQPDASGRRTVYCPYTALGELYTALDGGRQRATKHTGATLSPAEALDAALESFAGNRFADARRHLAQASGKGGKKDPRSQVLLGFILLLEKKYPQARAQFQLALKQRPRLAGAQVGLGHLAIIGKDYAVAGALLRPAAASPDPPPGAHRTRTYRWLVRRMAGLGLGWIAANQNHHAEAIKHFDRILSQNGDDIFALLGKGNSQSALGKLLQAEASLGRVLSLDPGNKYAMAELALVKHNRGQDAHAERLFKAALKLDPRRYTCPHEGLGLIYLRAGKLNQAKLSFRKAIAINPNIEYRKFNGLARILIREGKYAGARRLLRKSIQNYPHDDTARKLLESIKGK